MSRRSEPICLSKRSTRSRDKARTGRQRDYCPGRAAQTPTSKDGGRGLRDCRRRRRSIVNRIFACAMQPAPVGHRALARIVPEARSPWSFRSRTSAASTRASPSSDRPRRACFGATTGWWLGPMTSGRNGSWSWAAGPARPPRISPRTRTPRSSRSISAGSSSNRPARASADPTCASRSSTCSHRTSPRSAPSISSAATGSCTISSNGSRTCWHRCTG